MLRKRLYASIQNVFQMGFYRSYAKEKQCIVDKNMVDLCKPSPRVVIIGAGVAGLTAAERIFTSGITDVVVLEATERPGGRIHSCRLANGVAELGAQWIFDSAITNNITTLAAQEGLIDVICPQKPNDPISFNMNLQSNGHLVNQAVALKAYSLFQQIEQKAQGLHHLECGREHGSLLSYVTNSINQELQNFHPHQRAEAACIMHGLTNALKNRWGSDLENISADLYGNFTVTGGETIGVPFGFVSVLSPLLRTIPCEKVLYNKVVQNIRWSNVCNDDGTPAARAKVTCCDESVYCGDYVITTVSLGVLKAIGQTLYTPKLPEEKLEAIQKLGFGNTEKIYLLYETPFWVCSQGTINIAWSEADLKDKDNWMTGICAIEEAANTSQVLYVTVSGQQADKLESRNDLQVSEDLTRLMRKLTGNPSLPYPSSVLRSRWKSNPHFAGSNTYMAVQSNVGHQCDLSASIPISEAPQDKSKPPPLAPILFFAGEAVCQNFYSTVHGARKSGFLVAQEIIDLTKLYRGPPPLPGEEATEFEPWR